MRLRLQQENDAAPYGLDPHPPPPPGNTVKHYLWYIFLILFPALLSFLDLNIKESVKINEFP
jgi:hypothetical protein